MSWSPSSVGSIRAVYCLLARRFSAAVQCSSLSGLTVCTTLLHNYLAVSSSKVTALWVSQYLTSRRQPCGSVPHQVVISLLLVASLCRGFGSPLPSTGVVVGEQLFTQFSARHRQVSGKRRNCHMWISQRNHGTANSFRGNSVGLEHRPEYKRFPLDSRS